MSDDWRPASPAGKQAMLGGAGLSGPFWEVG